MRDFYDQYGLWHRLYVAGSLQPSLQFTLNAFAEFHVECFDYLQSDPTGRLLSFQSYNFPVSADGKAQHLITAGYSEPLAVI